MDTDPKVLGARLRDARSAKRLTQQEVADQLGLARTTLVAIEKGERRVQSGELVRLASAYGRPVHELLRSSQPSPEFAVQLRAVLEADAVDEQAISGSIGQFVKLCEDYVELERLTGATMPRRYPPMYEIQSQTPELVAEDVAEAERNRLGLGTAPISGLDRLLESQVGVRIFAIKLPSRVAAMFGYSEELGGCIAVNADHPPERQGMSVGHEYAHFLSSRYRPEVVLDSRYDRIPRQERFADAFARAFLMPRAGLRRQLLGMLQSRGAERATPADLCILASAYGVSVEAVSRRLEELGLIPPGSWDRLQLKGFRVREAQAELHLQRPVRGMAGLPERYVVLALDAIQRELITEGEFARFLRTDRVGARDIRLRALGGGAAIGDAVDESDARRSGE